MKLIYEDNAFEQAKKLLNKSYKYFKVIVVTNYTNKNVDAIIDNLNGNVKEIKVVKLPQGKCSFEISKQLICSQITDDVGLVIVIGDYELTRFILNLNLKIKKMLINITPLIPINASLFDYVIINNGIIEQCTNKDIANCYGYLSSFSIFILEEVFNKGVYLKDTNSNNLLELEKVVQSLNMIPSSILKSNTGKRMLTKISVKLLNLINLSEFENSFVFKLANNIKQNSKHLGLQFGESLMIGSVLGFKLFNVLLNSHIDNAKIGFDYFNRLKIAKKYYDNFSLSKIAKTFTLDNNLNESVINFNKIQNSFLMVFNSYLKMINNMVKTFKVLFYDNGIFLNKYLKSDLLLNSINLIPESCLECCFATFIRDVGLLNKF